MTTTTHTPSLIIVTDYVIKTGDHRQSNEPNGVFDTLEEAEAALANLVETCGKGDDYSNHSVIVRERVCVELDTPVGPRVTYLDGVDEEEVSAALPAGWVADFSSQIDMRGGWRAPLVLESAA